MKQLIYLLGIILLLSVSITSCKKNDTSNDGDNTVKSMDDLVISSDFDWKTTKTIDVIITLPNDNFAQVVSIYSNDYEQLYYSGYSKGSNLLSTKLTLPTSVVSAVIVYGLEEDFEPITVYVENDITADLSNLKTSLKGVLTCGCSGGIFSLTMRYNGTSTANIKVREKKNDVRIYCGTVSPDGTFTITGGSKKNGRFDNTIRFYIDNVENTSMHVSCSVPLEAGMDFGDFTVISGVSKHNKPLCGTPPPPPPPPPPPVDPPETTTVTFDGSLAYEDLWPGKGDYDFNDLIVNYDFSVTKDNQEQVLSITGVFTVYAFGATFYNGFGYSLPNVSPDQVISVSGYNMQPTNIFTLAANGLEDNQTDATVIVFDDSYNILQHPGVGIGVNTEASSPYIPIDSVVIQMVFFDEGSFAPGGAITFDQLDIGNFNPFIIVNQNRDVEVHLRDFAPSNLVDQAIFGTIEDDSDAGQQRYYTTVHNLPWAINIPIVFEYPYEKKEVTAAYLKFAEWAESDGVDYPDWYEDNAGYRNDVYIYTPPTK